MFAERTNWDLTPNLLAQQKEALRNEGAEILDLTESNPTKIGIRYPEDLLRSLTDPGCLIYDPHPKGILSARQAVSAIFSAKGIPLDPDKIFLTASTSEAYGFLFRLLANPGDQLLIPRPSYPLFSYLADLHDLGVVSYPLRLGQDGLWRIELDALEASITKQTRAIVVVHPNNPTGSCVTTEEQARLIHLCRQNDLALISDEVFAEYRSPTGLKVPATLLGKGEALTFSLGGLSKFLGLPQMKLAWIACSGPPEQLDRALERLELISDTSLSVNTPAQRAFPHWLKTAPAIQGQIRQRIEENRQLLQAHLNQGLGRLLPSEGGWSAVLGFPSLQDVERWALTLLKEDKVLVHPGYFFDFEEEGLIVISLLTPTDSLQEGIRRILSRFCLYKG